MSANYDKFPAVDLPAYTDQLWQSYPAIGRCLTARLAERLPEHAVLVIDTYPGVNDAELLTAIEEQFQPQQVINTLDLKLPEPKLLQLLDRHLTRDRIFGVMGCHQLTEFFDPDQLQAAQAIANAWTDGLLVIYGVGAGLVTHGDLLVFADLARWQILLRYRQGLGNWGADNGDEDYFRKYKRAYFVEWRAADRHKYGLFEQIDYFLDTNTPADPKLVTADVVHAGLRQTVQQPFRVVPFFDTAPWGGQWMKDVCDLDRDKLNFGWCFDCVVEENSLRLNLNGTHVEMPALNVVYRHPVELLGDQVHARFGREFPIRFDLLDTMEGGNLSCQIHPLTEYIQQTFGMHYTQDESYYLLDAGPDATVYLGLQEGIDPEAMVADLHAAQACADRPFQAEKYVNQWPAQKHDHFLIPGGTVHCSGANSMVLEISATPYIFTFKLWDWGRLGLDGLPRPVHLQHGVPNIQWHRTTAWVQQNLVNCIEPIAEGEGWREERTGLHEREFIETRRHWFTGTVTHHTGGGVNVLNLVQGAEAVVESPTDDFAPFVVHYAETFIVPAAIATYTIRPHGSAVGTECATIKAYVRT